MNKMLIILAMSLAPFCAFSKELNEGQIHSRNTVCVEGIVYFVWVRRISVYFLSKNRRSYDGSAKMWNCRGH